MTQKKQQKTLLQLVLQQQKLDVVNTYHLLNAGISITQDCADLLKDIIKPEMYGKKVTNDFVTYIEGEITKMQALVGDEQLLTLQNNECMKMVLKKVIECTKNGTIEDLCNTILDFENNAKTTAPSK